MHLDQLVTHPHCDQPQPKAAAQAKIILQRLGKPFPRATRHSNIDRIRHALPRDPLMKKRQAQRGFHLDNNKIAIAAHRDHVAGAHLRFHLIALPLKIALDGGV